ncbi:MAG: molybdopterin-dependent oxidoreductase [Chloroflexi bacterium]|nr:molybdopterin-dependent oxidoreductase [Chloroflexota bacterium]
MNDPSPAPPIERIPFTCTLDCGSRCELVACVREGRVLRVDTPADRPDTVTRPRLIPCARGRAQRRLLDIPERVKYPLRRTGPRGTGQFEVIEWDEALDTVASHLNEMRTAYGSESVLHAVGAGSITGRGFHGASAARRFFSYWGPVSEASGNESNHCAEMAAQWMLGGVVPGSDRATLLDARLIILWAMNPAETHMGPNTEYYITLARDRGARVILIDPRYTDSGILADEWIPIRPGTDAALVAALGYVMETEGLVDDFVHTHATGYEAYRRYLMGEADGVRKTPEWAQPITGVPAGTIRDLALAYATVKPAALLPGWGAQRTRFGEQIARAFITLACMSGNIGVRGGGLASVGTRSGEMGAPHLPIGPHHPSRQLSPGNWAASILDACLKPPLRMAHIVASNLINRSPDATRNAVALEALDFVVVNDQYLTPTARYADIVLPICTDLERSDLVASWGHDAHLFYSRSAIAPAGESRTDYWVFAQLAQRLGFGDAYTQGRTETEWIDQLLDSPCLERMTLENMGIMRSDGEPRVALAEFRAAPAAHPLPTRSGRIEVVSPEAEMYGLPPIPSYVADSAPMDRTYPLQLVTPHSKLRSNSCAYANPWLQQLEPHTIWINPRDATPRGIVQDAQVEVHSKRGAVIIPAKVTERIMPGVVCIYQGTWYRLAEDGQDHGGCANTLTDQVESPSGGYATHSVWVDVRRRDE